MHRHVCTYYFMQTTHINPSINKIFIICIAGHQFNSKQQQKNSFKLHSTFLIYEIIPNSNHKVICLDRSSILKEDELKSTFLLLKKIPNNTEYLFFLKKSIVHTGGRTNKRKGQHTICRNFIYKHFNLTLLQTK